MRKSQEDNLNQKVLEMQKVKFKIALRLYNVFSILEKPYNITQNDLQKWEKTALEETKVYIDTINDIRELLTDIVREGVEQR